MSVEVDFVDGEAALIDWLLDGALAARTTIDATVGNNLPGDWTVSSKPHLMVAHDGTPGAVWPIEEHQTIRVTAFARYQPDARALARAAHRACLAYPGKVDHLIGVAPAGKDPTTGAELASGTVRFVAPASQIA